MRPALIAALIRFVHIVVFTGIGIDDTVIRRTVVGGGLVAILETAERYLDGLLLAVTHYHHVDLFADGAFGHHARQVAHLADDLAVEFQDHVARP